MNNSYQSSYFNKGTGLSFTPYSITSDIAYLKLSITGLNSNINTLNSNVTAITSNIDITSSNVSIHNKLSVDSDFSVNTSNLFVKTSGANAGWVGIGTTISQSVLHILDESPLIKIQDIDAPSTNISSTSGLAFMNSNGDQFGYLGYSFGPDLLILNGANTLGGKIRIYTNSLERMTLANDGNIGIGSTTPAYKLDVAGTLRATGAITAGSTITATGAITSSSTISGTNHASTASLTGTTVISNPTSVYGSMNISGTARGGYLGYCVNNSSGYVDNASYMGIYDFVNGNWMSYKDKAANQTVIDGHMNLLGNFYQSGGDFQTNVIVTSSKALGVGVAAPSYKLQLLTDSAAKPGSVAWTIASDIRIKKDIEIADYDRCYDIIDSLDLKKYSWRDDIPDLDSNCIRDRSKLGWIANDVQSVFPKAVNVIPEMYGISNLLDLNVDQIYASMYGCMKKMIGEIKVLQSLCEANHANINILLDRIEVLESG
jgi:hypothetical protein